MYDSVSFEDETTTQHTSWAHLDESIHINLTNIRPGETQKSCRLGEFFISHLVDGMSVYWACVYEEAPLKGGVFLRVFIIFIHSTWYIFPENNKRPR